MQTNRLFLALAILLSQSLSGAAIFGDDNREDVNPNSPFGIYARSTAVSILSSNYAVNAAGKIDIDVSGTQLCSDEKFSNQPALSYSCAGFLIAPDLLVTAGHCVYAVNTPNQEHINETKHACETFLWMFDYQKNATGAIQVRNLPPENLFKCKQIVYAVQRDVAPFPDYAIIQLDRPVVGRIPFKISSTDAQVGDSLSAYGFPYGSPVKRTNNGRVILNNLAHSDFVTTLDVFQGNSGGPVLNKKNEVVGILVGGTPADNTYTDPVNKCERFNRCKEDGTGCKAPDLDTSLFPGFQVIGSDVQRIAPVRDLLLKLRPTPLK